MRYVLLMGMGGVSWSWNLGGCAGLYLVGLVC